MTSVYGAATHLVGQGMDVATVAARLGHSSSKMTLDTYTHPIQQRDQEAAEMLGAVLGPTGLIERRPVTPAR